MRAPIDSTVPFLQEGYPFVSSRCDELGTDLFTSRLLLRPVTFLRGAEAAAIFYDDDRFTRQGAMPPTVQHLLQDKGSVQALDGAAHHERKELFLSLMSREAMDRLGDIFDEEWDAVLHSRPGPRRIVVHGFAREVLTRSVCRWSGIPLEVTDVPRLRDDLGMMVDNAGRFDPRNLYAQWRRRGTEKWAKALIAETRRGIVDPPRGSALSAFARHRESDGSLLSPEVAAVELINILRPMVALDRFIVFAATALHTYPQWRETFASGDESDLEPFVQEVRRFYPFFPVVPGRVATAFEWRGHDFAQGDWVILDLYGTCHDSRIFEDPDSFRPERFRGFRWEEQPNGLIAQGAGRHQENHRCPGEWSTVELLKRSVRALAAADFDVPVQDLTIPLDQFPTLPRSGFLVHAA